ncbi:ROK family protein [Longivirga aurantiaca]|uniref:ROK family protein n=1 Tax=Longivirga aurantiaca TaxID=1837743 RepID=A0ABW1SWK7_9ACTN
MSIAPTPPSRRPRPTDQADVRRHNAGLVLAAVTDGPVSRAEVAGLTGLTRATVGSIVDDLLAAGLVSEQGTRAPRGVGRPGTDLALDPSGGAGVGVEINVDGLSCVVVDLTGEVRHRASRPGDQRDKPVGTVLRTAARLVDDALRAAAADGLRVRGIGVAVPGLVDLEASVLRVAPNLGWADVPVLDRMRAASSLLWPRASLDNEANLAALGELWSGDHAWPAAGASFVLVNGDVGVGAGVVLEGRLHRGTRGFGGELGHLTVAPDGPECRCGARGCLEQVAGLDWILRSAGLRPSSAHGADATPTLLAALAEGEPRAVGAVEDAGASLGVGIAAIVNLFDVDAVVLGGVYAPLFPWLEAPVRAAVARRVLSARWAPISIAPSRLGRDAAVVGAARSALREVLTDPLGAVAEPA